MSNITIKSYRKEREAEIMNGLEKSMMAVKRLVVEQTLANLRHGRPYPKWDTGRLGSNIAEYSHIEKEGNTITAFIGTNVPYGLYLELGALRKDGSVVHYPWLFPAVERKRQEIIETIKAGGGKVTGIEVVGGIWEK